jgi:hypothetical protein
MFLLVYVDDIILVSSSSMVVSDFLCSLQQDFALKDLGSLHYFLGIEVQRTSEGLQLSQKKYTNDLLQCAGMLSCKLVSTLLATSMKISAHEGELLSSEDVAKYHGIVGALQYFTLTRPDIAYTVNKVCQYLHAPQTPHWTAVKWILRFLKHTTGFGCLIQSSSSTMVSAFSDDDWAGCTDNRKSTAVLRYILGPISSPGVQRSRRQFHDRVRRLNTRQWPTRLLKLCGFRLFFVSCRFHALEVHAYGVTTWEPSI